MTSETADIKIQNVSNDVAGIGNTVVDKINNYFNSECIDNEEFNRLKGLITVEDRSDYGSTPEQKREVIIEALLNMDNPTAQKEIIKTGTITTYPYMSYQINTDSFAIGSNYEKHNYTNYSRIHILPSVIEITTEMFKNNKMTSSYFFYKPVKLNPGCFPATSNMRYVIFNFSYMTRGALQTLINMNKDVKVFDEIKKNIDVVVSPDHNDLRQRIRDIFNMANTNDNPLGGNDNNTYNPSVPGGLPNIPLN